MRVGFVSLYSWRPHVEHLFYLASLVTKAGHEVRYLTCDANMPTCYTRELRPQRHAMLECAMCRAGGVRSYTSQGVSSIGSIRSQQPLAGPVPEGHNWGASSASTIGRFESDRDYETREFAAVRDRLNKTATIGYEAARAWIAGEMLDAIVVFNGRMDGLRGIMEAAKATGTRVITMERTWFGDGLQLLPDENCLGLRSVNRMVKHWSEIPLTRSQALSAATLVAQRFLRTNTKEWRAYNVAARVKPWPVDNAAHKVLLVPGSRNEIWGHPDWKDGWDGRTQSYDALIAHLGLAPTDIVLRAHPNWGERIGHRTGELSERYYREWANARGIVMIGSTEKTSTLGLIEQADLVVVSGGSAALEAGVIGKRIISLSPSNYQEAGIAEEAHTLEQMRFIMSLDAAAATERARHVAAHTLRFCYTSAYRLPQFARYVRCITPTQYQYSDGADPQRIVRLIETGELIADDSETADDACGENEVIQMIAERRWADIMQTVPAGAELPGHRVNRRPLFRMVDVLRARTQRGDM